MPLPTNKVGMLHAEIDSGGTLRSAGDRVIVGAKNSKSEQEWIVRQKIAECSARITEAVHDHGGVVTRRTAEMLFASFADARGVFDAACRIQKEHADGIREAAELTNTAPLGLRVGLTFGKMAVDAGRVSGEPIDVARQMANRANSGQVIAAESLVNMLGDEVRESVRTLGSASFDNVQGETEMFEVRWDGVSNSATAYADTVAVVEPPPMPKLEVRSRGKAIVLDPDHPSVTLRSGKQREPHARLEFRNDSFYLVNLRANGTRVRGEDGAEALCLDEQELTGEGAISLGAEFTEGSTDMLTFSRLA